MILSATYYSEETVLGTKKGVFIKNVCTTKITVTAELCTFDYKHRQCNLIQKGHEWLL